MSETDFMKTALALAEKGIGFTSPNPMAGAVVVKDGKIVGRGFHEAVGRPHAEVNAIADAGDAARDATLYVTLEPCNHTGRTPPCTERILDAGIKRVTAAMADPNPDVAGGGFEYLRQSGIDVSVGLCRAEAEKLNESFIKYVRTRQPFVILKCASTLDGQIATRTGDAEWVSGPESRQHVHCIRHAVDAIMVGVGTVHADNPSLTTRLENTKGRDPIRIILDTNLSIPEDAKVLRLRSESDTILVYGKTGAEDKKARIEKMGVRVLNSPLKDGKIDLIPLVDRLGAMGITSLLIEGGGRVIASAVTSGIVDKILFFFAPKLSGGNDGVAICAGKGAATMDGCIPIEEMAVRRFGQDLLVEGYVRH